jgi:site-specific recombinase XerD
VGSKRTVEPIIATSVGDVRALVPSFLRHLRATNKSEATIEAYKYAAEGLAVYLGTQGMPTQADLIRREHVEAYIQDLLDHRSPATANQRYRSLQQFFRWLLEEGEIRESPMTHMRPPTIPEAPVAVVSDDDLRAILATCDNSFEGRRDEAILRVFIDSGARLAEVAGLRIGDDPDVDLDGGVLRVTGKGRRQRLAGIGPKTARAIDRYLRKRAGSRHADLPWLWLSAKGRMTESGIRQMVWRRSTEAGVPRVHPHQLRHTHAHRWLAEGGSETGLMRKAGWRSRAMLNRYASSTAEARALEESKRLGLGDRL